MNLNPIAYYEGNAAYTRGGSFILGYEMLLPEAFSLSEEKTDEMQAAWDTFIKRFPVGGIVHLFSGFIGKKVSAGELPQGTPLRDAFAQHVDGRDGIADQHFLFCSFPRLQGTSSTLVNPFRAMREFEVAVAEQNFINHSFRDAVNNLVVYLNSTKNLKVAALSEDEMRYFSFEYFNLFEYRHTAIVDFDQHIKVESNSVNLTVGERYVGMFSIYNEVQLPNEVATVVPNRAVDSRHKFKTSLGNTLGVYLRHPHYLSTVIYKDDKERWRAKLDLTIGECKRVAWASSAIKETQEELTELQRQLGSDYNNESVVRTNTSVVFWAEREQFSRVKSEINAAFTAADIIPSNPTGKVLKNAFITTNPFFSEYNSSITLYPTFSGVPVAFIPTEGEYRSDEEGIYYFDKFNAPRRVDMWDAQKRYLKSRNFLVFAPSGGGKSVSLLWWISQLLEQQFRMVIIDLGRSFYKFAQLLEEMGIPVAYVEYKDGAPLGINPFAKPMEKLREVEQLNELAELVYCHCCDTEVPISEDQRGFLRNVLRDYIAAEQPLSVPGFARYLCDNESSLRAKYSEALQYFDYTHAKLLLNDFMEGGAYHFIYKDSGKSITAADGLGGKQIIFYEFEQAVNNPRMLNVLLQLSKSSVLENIWNDPTTKGIVLLEEAAKFLKYPSVVMQAEYYAQAIRKKEGAFGMVLQAISQIPQGNATESIIENTQLIMALENTKGYHSLIERMKVQDEHKVRMMNSVHNNFSGDEAGRRYSEIFIERNGHYNVYRIELPRLQYLSFITDGQDQDRINALVAQGMTVTEAIQKLL